MSIKTRDFSTQTAPCCDAFCRKSRGQTKPYGWGLGRIKVLVVDSVRLTLPASFIIHKPFNISAVRFTSFSISGRFAPGPFASSARFRWTENGCWLSHGLAVPSASCCDGCETTGSCSFYETETFIRFYSFVLPGTAMVEGYFYMKIMGNVLGSYRYFIHP